MSKSPLVSPPCGATPVPSRPTYLPGWGVRCGCVCSGSDFGCTPPLLAGVSGCVCACVRAQFVPRHCWLGCAAWVCLLGLGFRLRPTTPGWGVGLCVCLCACSACTPLLLARVCGVGVCAWAQVSAAPRLSRLGCWGVRICVRTPLGPRHSWLGCAAWVCVLGVRFRLRPATAGWGVEACVCALCLYPASPGWGVWCGCVCLGSGFGSAPRLLARVSGSVCACVRVSLVPRHSWLGCAVRVYVLGLGYRLRLASSGSDVGVCLFVCSLRLHPATPCCGVRRGCVCPWLRFGLHPTTPGWGVGVYVCSCARSSGAPPLLAGVLGCVCVCVRAPPVPCHS